MPTKNRPDMILDAIAGIRAQDFQDWELLIYDAGESVREILPREPRIRYWHGDEDARMPIWLSEAQGGVLNVHADDDTLLPGVLSHVNEVIGDRKWMYGRIKAVPDGWTMGAPWAWERLKAENFIPAPAVFWTREARDAVGGFEAGNPWCPDWDYWLRLGARWEPLFTERILVNYRIHPGQDTCRLSDEVKATNGERILGRARSGYYEAQACA